MGGNLEEILMGAFLNGQKDDICVEVKLFNPRNVGEVMVHALKIKEKNWVNDLHSRLLGPEFMSPARRKPKEMANLAGTKLIHMAARD